MEALGIEPILLIGQIINFVVLFLILRKFLYKPVLSLLKKRKQEIEESLTRARRIEEEESKMKEKQEKLVSDAKKEVRLLLEEAKKQAKEQETRIVEVARKEAQEILAKAKSQAQQQLKEAEGEMKKQAVELAGTMVAKLIPTILSEDNQRKLIASHLKELEKMAKIVH